MAGGSPRAVALAFVLAASNPAAAFGQAQAPQADPAAVVDQFLRTLRSGHHDRLGSLVTERVATDEGHSLSRSQIVLLHEGFTAMMFGPLRAYDCEAPASSIVTCTLRFQTRSLRQRYTVTSGLISGIETIPFASEPTGK
jgi:hypothetical protein